MQKITKYLSIKNIIIFIGSIFSLFHLYTAYFGLLTPIKQRAIHLMFVLILGCFLNPLFKKDAKIKKIISNFYSLIFISLSVLSMIYIVYHYEEITIRGGIPNKTDIIMGLIALFLVFEAGRRILGWALPLIAIGSIAFLFLGPYLPDVFSHKGFSLLRIVDHFYMTLEGIFGIAIGVSSTYVVLFIIFASFLTNTGATEFIRDIGLAIAGSSIGGPAKVAVIASGALGMINGSSPANVATTGSFTIPFMIKLGYSPVFAGAVEAAASTGGQLMPPVMGVAAFIMAEFLGVPYLKIIKSGILPALFFYIGIWVIVHLRSLKKELPVVPKSELPNILHVLKQKGHLVLPVVIIVVLIIKNYTPIYAAIWGIISLIVVSFVSKETRLSVKGIINSLYRGAMMTVPIATACAVIGIVIGTISLSGIGLTIGHQIVSWAHGLLLPTLFLSMVVSIFLGMGLPTSGAYIIVSSFAASAIVQSGVEEIVGHFFLFYFACLSAITPPVALAAYVGAGIAKANPNQVGFQSVLLASAGFLSPFVFVYNPAIILWNLPFFNMIILIITKLLGIIFLGIAIEGYFLTRLNNVERILSFISAMCFVGRGLYTDLAGLLFAVVVFFLQFYKIRKNSEVHS